MKNLNLFSQRKQLKILLSGIAFKGYPITDDIRGTSQWI